MSLVLTITGTIIALAIGVWMLVGGLRGRRLDDHVVCRRCRFDLSGSIPGMTLCPECGMSLAAPRAIAIGNRRSSPLLAGAGVLLMFTAVGGGGTLIALNQGGLGLVKYAPSRILVWVPRLISLESSVSMAVLKELDRRLERGELSLDVVLEVARIGLRAQADMSTPWNWTWGSFIENARTTLRDEEWQAYLVNALGPVTVHVPTAVAEGEAVTVGVQIGPGRTALQSRISMTAQIHAIRIGPVVVPTPGAECLRSMSAGMFTSTQTFPAYSSVGEWLVTVPIHIEFADNSVAPAAAGHLDLIASSVNPIHITPRPTPPRLLIHDPHLAPSPGAWTIEHARLVQQDKAISPHDRLEFWLIPKESLKAAMSFDVWLSYPERPEDPQSSRLRVKFDGYGLSVGYQSTLKTFGQLPSDFPFGYYRAHTGTVDFELVPRRFQDGDHFRNKPIWGETIVIPQVPVRMKSLDDTDAAE